MSKSTEDLIKELEAGGVLGRTPAQPPIERPATPSTKARGRLGTSGVVPLLVAAVLVAVIGSLPFGSIALYPFALFVTLVHETSHALAAVATGGSVASISISPDLSGLTRHRGGEEALIAPAGYLGATLAGVALLLIPLRYARWVLGALATVPLIDLILFHPASGFTALWCLLFALMLGASAWKLPPRLAAFLQIFLGVEAGLNAFRDLTTLLLISSTNAHIQTDADNMSRVLFLPPIFWAVLWTVLSLALLAGALLVLVRRDLSALRAKGRTGLAERT